MAISLFLFKTKKHDLLELKTYRNKFVDIDILFVNVNEKYNKTFKHIAYRKDLLTRTMSLSLVVSSFKATT